MTHLLQRGFVTLACVATTLGCTGREAPKAQTAEASAALAAAAPGATEILVYKSPTCGCCTSWVDYMRANGYRVTVRDVDDPSPIKDESGVPMALRSCHTGIVNGYVIEGHVPAEDVARLLRDKPKVVGLAVPGMVTGSPGMVVPGQSPEHYDVMAFDAQGKTTVFAKR